MQPLPRNPWMDTPSLGRSSRKSSPGATSVGRAYVDRDHKRLKHAGKAKVYIIYTCRIRSPTIRRELRRRNAVESRRRMAGLCCCPCQNQDGYLRAARLMTCRSARQHSACPCSDSLPLQGCRRSRCAARRSRNREGCRCVRSSARGKITRYCA